MNIRIIDSKDTFDEMMEKIEGNLRETILTREEISKLKLQNKKVHTQVVVDTTPKEKEVEEKEPYCDIDFEEEMEYYLDDYKALELDNLEENLLELLPSRKNYRYKDVILRLIAESLKEIKEINEFISKEELTADELEEFKSFILLEQQKIKILKENLKTKTETQTEEEIENEIILIPNLSGNPKVIEDLEHIHPSFYEDFLELVESVKNGTFKGVKRFSGNSNFAGISEVRGFQVRIAFTRVGKNKYALITAFVKKSDNDKGYRESLTLKLSDYRILEPKIKTLVENEEFIKQNVINVERLYALLGKEEDLSKKEVL